MIIKLTEEDIHQIIKNSINQILKENNDISSLKVLYHATPSCYLSSIKKYGLGGKMPKKRFWDYQGTEYESIQQGFFLATDEYVAMSYLEASEDFEEFAEQYEERYYKELGIIVFEIDVNKLDLNRLHIDSNQLLDDETDPTYFYDGVIPFKDLRIIKI